MSRNLKMEQITNSTGLDYVLKFNKMLDEEMSPLLPDFLRPISVNEESSALDSFWQDILSGKNSFALLAWADGKPVGMALIEEEKVCHLESLIVLSEYRRQGIGKALIERAKQMAAERGNRIMTLNVLPENKSAKQLYGNTGFSDFRTMMAIEL